MTDGSGMCVFRIDAGLQRGVDALTLARALRRAVLARVQARVGASTPMPTFFTGHEKGREGPSVANHAHVSFVCDLAEARLIILAPHVVGRRAPSKEDGSHVAALAEALDNFWELRAGRSGRLVLSKMIVDVERDRLFRCARVWESATAYAVTRHAKNATAYDVLATDIGADCLRHGLPTPCVTPLAARGVSGMGLCGEARITFDNGVRGPILLGRTRHFGGGLFAAIGE